MKEQYLPLLFLPTMTFPERERLSDTFSADARSWASYPLRSIIKPYQPICLALSLMEAKIFEKYFYLKTYFNINGQNLL